MDPSSRRPWTPIIDGPEAEAVRAVVEEIARAVETPPREPGLASGAAGSAGLFGQLADTWPERGFGEVADQHLDVAIEGLATQAVPPDLFGGFAGVAWSVEHLRGRFESGDEDANEEIDEALLARLRTSPWQEDYDLINGLAGYGVYAIERSRRPIGRACLAEVVRRLDELAEPRPGGLTWPTPPALMPPETRAQNPQGWDNLGVAHGAPAAALVLAGACVLDVERERARRLVDGSMRWIFAQRHDDGPSAFPYCVTTSAPWTPARSAWCYGDPGAAACLLAAARALGEPGWEAEALAVGRRAAARPMNDCGARDAGACHGTAGQMLMYQRLWHASGESVFADAARRWLARTLELREPGRGVAGFLALNPNPERPFGGELEWTNDESLLTGAVGIALCLLAAVTPVEPAWDRVLAVSLPG
jgi:hypothetical protein